jgi:hypothetical protein
MQYVQTTNYVGKTEIKSTLGDLETINHDHPMENFIIFLIHY